MIIDTTQTKMELRVDIADIKEQLTRVANDPNLVLTTGPIWFGPIHTPNNSWKTCSPGSPQDLAIKKMEHHDWCECPECLCDFYNPTYKILCKTITGPRCRCGSVDFGLVVKCVKGQENGPSFICKKCNKWEWYER